ncbi:MAG: O-antigen ligase family protein [Proteobacteria bacterium]|nr:O-antigen ligase family protein [Pseudomonadota bacterium]
MNAMSSPVPIFTRAAILSVAAFLVPFLAMPTPRFAAVLLSVVSVVFFVVFRPRLGFLRAVDGALFALVAVFIVWMIVTIVWSLFPAPFAVRTVAQVAGASLAGLITIATARSLDEDGRRRVADALAAGVAVALLVLLCVYLVELNDAIRDLQGSFLFARHFDRGATVAAILLWPALHGLVRAGRVRVAIGLFLLTCVAVGISYSLAAKAALAVGLITAGVTWRIPRTGTIAAGVLMVAVFLAMPLAGSAIPPPEQTAQWPGLNASAHHRLTIWRHVSGLISNSPWIGHGIESSRIFGDKRTITALLPGRPPAIEELLPLHPHNAALQIYLELGAVGALLAAAILGMITWCIARAPVDRVSTAAAAAALGSVYTIAMLSYGIWQSWWLCTIWFAAVFTLANIGRQINWHRGVPTNEAP